MIIQFLAIDKKMRFSFVENRPIYIHCIIL